MTKSLISEEDLLKAIAQLEETNKRYSYEDEAEKIMLMPKARANGEKVIYNMDIKRLKKEYDKSKRKRLIRINPNPEGE